MQRHEAFVMFITFEGIEGSGKTTQIKRLSIHLQQKGENCIITREPGGTAIGAKIRAILLDPASGDLAPEAELLLYLADRAQHIKQVIQPYLKAGNAVLCDRFYDATMVYQGFARGLNPGLISQLHQIMSIDLRPDITLLLDLAPQEGLRRAWAELKKGSRVGCESRFEEETLAFHEKVRAGYLKLAHQEPHRFCVVDAQVDEEQVHQQIIQTLDKWQR